MNKINSQTSLINIPINREYYFICNSCNSLLFDVWCDFCYNNLNIERLSDVEDLEIIVSCEGFDDV